MAGFEPKRPVAVASDDQKSPPLVRRYSIATSSVRPHFDVAKQKVVVAKLNKLKDKVQVYEYFIYRHYSFIEIREFYSIYRG